MRVILTVHFFSSFERPRALFENIREYVRTELSCVEKCFGLLLLDILMPLKMWIGFAFLV